jgi:hypothetical protein
MQNHPQSLRTVRTTYTTPTSRILALCHRQQRRRCRRTVLLRYPTQQAYQVMKLTATKKTSNTPRPPRQPTQQAYRSPRPPHLLPPPK